MDNFTPGVVTGVRGGDTVTVRLWRDERPRGVSIPEDVERALATACVLDTFSGWSPSHQREYLLAIDEAKKPETRSRRIERTIETLRRA